MRVVSEQEPAEVRVQVELTGREVALLARATFKTDIGKHGPLQQENDRLWDELDRLRDQLGAEDLDCANDLEE